MKCACEYSDGGIPIGLCGAHQLVVDKRVAAEREACASKSREFAAHYPQSSDGRNTFILLAEWIESR